MSPVLIGEILSVLVFFGLIAALMLGYQIAFTLPGVALIFANQRSRAARTTTVHERRDLIE